MLRWVALVVAISACKEEPVDTRPHHAYLCTCSVEIANGSIESQIWSAATQDEAEDDAAHRCVEISFKTSCTCTCRLKSPPVDAGVDSPAPVDAPIDAEPDAM